jgi:Zn-dependent protease with chaperone function
MINKTLAAVNIGQAFHSPFGVTKTVSDLVTLVIRGSFIGSGLVLLFFFVGAGLQILSGAGNNDPKQTAQGQQALTATVIGFIVVFLAYWIVRFIELAITGDTLITNPFSGLPPGCMPGQTGPC